MRPVLCCRVSDNYGNVDTSRKLEHVSDINGRRNPGGIHIKQRINPGEKCEQRRKYDHETARNTQAIEMPDDVCPAHCKADKEQTSGNFSQITGLI